MCATSGNNTPGESISMAKKFDGVTEAIRYKDGKINVVRAFERRGAAFGDRVWLSSHCTELTGYAA
jgi:hypothetical protein